MVATLSPAADNFEETLSTLRYADRAKRIINHAVVNEDPNARIIRELRAEVDALKEMLKHATQPDVLKEKLSENEKLMKEMSLTWEEKLYKTGQTQEDRRQALEKLGISVKVEKNRYFLVNLNSDPSLNEMLVYYLKPKTLVGRTGAPANPDIQLSGVGIQNEHCVIEMDESGEDILVSLTPLNGARTCVNGVEIAQPTTISNGDRILWGSNHFFRVNCPKNSGKYAASRCLITCDIYRRICELIGIINFSCVRLIRKTDSVSKRVHQTIWSIESNLLLDLPRKYFILLKIPQNLI